MTAWASLDTPIGSLVLEGGTAGFTALHLPNRHPPSLDPREYGSELLAEPLRQLSEYFAGDRTAFTLPLDLHGGPFDQAVWHALTNVPYGDTVTYTELARAVGRPDRVRAVAAGYRPCAVCLPESCAQWKADRESRRGKTLFELVGDRSFPRSPTAETDHRWERVLAMPGTVTEWEFYCPQVHHPGRCDTHSPADPLAGA